MSRHEWRPCACIDCVRRDQVDEPGDPYVVLLAFLVAAVVVLGLLFLTRGAA